MKLKAQVEAEDSINVWMLNCGGDWNDDAALSIAIWIYAVYVVTNHYRANDVWPDMDTAADALVQASKRVVEGHTRSTTWLDNRWQKPISILG